MVKKIIFPFLGKLLIRTIFPTLKIIRADNSGHEELLKKYGNIIYAFWHGRLFPLIYMYRNKNINILVSNSRDGDLTSAVCESFGFPCSRGSSTRGGVKGLIELMSGVSGGFPSGFAVDGPLGPKYEVKDGVIYFAQKLKFPIIPVTSSARPAIKFNSWDEFRLPLPFGKLAIVTGRPIFVNETDDLEIKNMELKNELNHITETADRLVC